MTTTRPKSRRRPGQNGIAIILLSLMLSTILLPMVGLAYDLTILYIVKAKLGAAVDSAVLAAGRSLVGSLSIAAQETQVTTIATDFLNANMPAGYWGTTGTPTIETPAASLVTQSSTTHRIYIKIQASVQVPLIFLQVFQNTATVRASAEASRRFLRMVIVLDRSSSMTNTEAELKLAVSNSNLANGPYGFVQNFSEGSDQLGMVVFGGSAIVAYPPRDATTPSAASNLSGPDPYFLGVLNANTPNIPSLVPDINAGSNTGTAEALILAYKELTKQPQQLYYNVIVLFTDGLPNGFTAGWNGANPPFLNAQDTSTMDVTSPTTSSIKTGSPCTYGLNKFYTTNQIAGWVAQWGNYANSDLHLYGIWGTMQLNPDPSVKYTNAGADVDNWLKNSDDDDEQSATALWATNSNLCAYTTVTEANPSKHIAGNYAYAENDVQSFPMGDLYGNGLQTADYQKSWNYHLIGVSLSSTDITNSYQIGNVSWNAAYNAGMRIRSDTTLNPTIFAIGYLGNGGVDHALLKMLTNTTSGFQTWAQDPTGQYQSTDVKAGQTNGMYYDAGPGGIAEAFQQVKSQVLSLAQ